MWTQLPETGRGLAHWEAITGYRRRTTSNMAQRRFLQLADVAEILNISAAQTYALVRNGDLPAVKIGGRGQWRVEQTQLEQYIERLYEQTRHFVADHPLGKDGAVDDSEMQPAGSTRPDHPDAGDRDGQRLPD